MKQRAVKERKFENLQLQFSRYVIGHIHKGFTIFSQSNSIELKFKVVKLHEIDFTSRLEFPKPMTNEVISEFELSLSQG